MDGRLTTGTARWARGGVVGALTIGLGSAAHVAGGGEALGPLAVAALVAVVAPLAVALSGRRWTVRPLLGIFLLAQAGVHVASMTGPTSSGHAMGSQTSMVLAHAAAAGLLVAAVLVGERALLALLDRLVLRAGCLVARAVVVTRSTVVVARLATRTSSPHLAALRGRGPPATA